MVPIEDELSRVRHECATLTRIIDAAGWLLLAGTDPRQLAYQLHRAVQSEHRYVPDDVELVWPAADLTWLAEHLERQLAELAEPNS